MTLIFFYSLGSGDALDEKEELTEVNEQGQEGLAAKKKVNDHQS